MRKHLKKSLSAFAVIIIIITAFYYLWLVPRYTVPILMYHRIGESEDGNDQLFVSKDSFKRQMAYLNWRGYNVISMDELVSGIRNNRKFGRNTVVITIDDGYEDNFTNAYPVLKEHDFPAIIFVITNNINKDDFLKNHQIIKALSESKVTFGSHTKNHAYLPDVKDPKELKDEILSSKQDLEALTLQSIDYFCYPSGGFTEQAKKFVKQAGYKGACTTNRGNAKYNKDIYELKRIKIKNSDFVEKPASFFVKLSGYYNVFRKGKNPY